MLSELRLGDAVWGNDSLFCYKIEIPIIELMKKEKECPPF